MDEEDKKEIGEPAGTPTPEAAEKPAEMPEISRMPETGNDAESLKQLKEEVEQAEISAPQLQQTQSDAQLLAQQDDDQKVRNLLELSKTKGVIYAVKVAQKLNDPYILDRLHDELISQGLYKR